VAHSLDQILGKAKHELIISGHTLDRFSKNDQVKHALLEVLRRGVVVTVIQLNPKSKAAEAHLLYHELESRSAAAKQHEETLEFFRVAFGLTADRHKQNLQVIFTNYMPRFRCVVVDHCVYVYSYMYATDVSDTPDLILTGRDTLEHETLRLRILQSTRKLIDAPETIPFIRSGRIFEYWRTCKIASWDTWEPEERLRHRIIHEFYVQYASQFDERFGLFIEREVAAHLDCLHGPTLVVGCGSGKEVFYLKKDADRLVVGLDFSPVAIELAKSRRPELKDHFMVGDFYDLDHLFDRQFESVVANAAFVHLLRREDINDILQKVWRRLAPGGMFFLRGLFKEDAGGNPMSEEMDHAKDRWDADRWFVYYARKELEERCAAIGFELMTKVTDKIAKGLSMGTKVAREKGFPHINYPRVYWPTLLLRRPAGS
jgi:SAM-dependent methyltransferase